jgi:2-(1,2-epoxy-1,2-dihydrophenyl)acetyl-CoA isomerase
MPDTTVRVEEDGAVALVTLDRAGAANAIGRQLAAGPKNAFGKTKRLIGRALGELESHMAIESETIASQAITAEGLEGINAFLGKRSADYIERANSVNIIQDEISLATRPL